MITLNNNNLEITEGNTTPNSGKMLSSPSVTPEMDDNMKTLTLIYDGIKNNRAVWFHFDKKKNQPSGDGLYFKISKQTTRFPVGMIVEVEEDDGYRFADAELGEMWNNEEAVNIMVLADRVEQQKRSTKRTENKLKKELGENWQDMTFKQIREQFAYMRGVDRTNAMALILRNLGI